MESTQNFSRKPINTVLCPINLATIVLILSVDMIENNKNNCIKVIIILIRKSFIKSKSNGVG